MPHHPSPQNSIFEIHTTKGFGKVIMCLCYRNRFQKRGGAGLEEGLPFGGGGEGGGLRGRLGRLMEPRRRPRRWPGCRGGGGGHGSAGG